MDVLRHGGMGRLFDGIRAPSTGAGHVVGGRVDLPGHDQRAVHDRITRQWGSTLGFIDWFDVSSMSTNITFVAPGSSGVCRANPISTRPAGPRPGRSSPNLSVQRKGVTHRVRGSKLGYARVSTAEQNADLQTDELTAAGCWKVFVDQASGALDRRPELDQVLEQLRPGDTMVVWRLDRLGRSLRHLIDTVTALDERGVGFRSLRESIDTTTAGGRLVFHIFGALAQFEREIIRDRTVAGLAAARARGRRGGRPSKLSPDQRRTARKLYDEREHTVEQIGRILGVSRTSIYRALQADTATLNGGDGHRSPGRSAAARGAGG